MEVSKNGERDSIVPGKDEVLRVRRRARKGNTGCGRGILAEEEAPRHTHTHSLTHWLVGWLGVGQVWGLQQGQVRKGS